MSVVPIEAGLLRPGDYLPGSQETVNSRPTRGVTTPAGKVDIVLSRGGRTRLASWGARTTIRVQRA